MVVVPVGPVTVQVSVTAGFVSLSANEPMSVTGWLTVVLAFVGVSCTPVGPLSRTRFSQISAANGWKGEGSRRRRDLGRRRDVPDRSKIARASPLTALPVRELTKEPAA